MRENNNTDNKLRQLENQSLPELSKQDMHWQEMRKMLQPDLAPPKPSISRKLWKWFIAACVVTATLLFIEKKLRKEKSNTNPITTVQPIQQKKILADTLKKIITVDTTTKPATFPKNETGLAMQKASENKKQTYASLVSEKCNKCGTDWLNDTAVSANAPLLPYKADEPKATLASFFAELEKPSQEFVVDNSKDTVITGTDGTALLIPANTFNTTEKVTIILKEYYSYEDIITNKLSTMSNGQQLVSGGMIHLYAMINGKEVAMQPQKKIRWFIPDTSSNIKNMQLFTGHIQNYKRQIDNDLANQSRDTSSYEDKYANINWIAQRQSFQTDFLITVVKVLDLRDLPYKTKENKRGKIGKFTSIYNSKKKKLLRNSLKEKYGYDKVIIRGLKNTNESIVGDSIWIEKKVADRFKLPYKDSIICNSYKPWRNSGFRYYKGNYISYSDFYFEEKRRKRIVYDTIGKKRQQDLSFNNILTQRFSVDITTLGWINCDRFYNDNRSKVPLYVDLKDTAANYYTILVFDKIKSMMTGSVSGNRVMFSNIPEGETAKIISIGIKNGKPVAAMESVQISSNTFSGLKFEETTPAAFRAQAATMDK